MGVEPGLGRARPSSGLNLVSNKLSLDATSKCVPKNPVGRVACVIDCLWRGLGKADARNQGTSNPAPARIPLFPATLLDKMRRATGGSLVGMEPPLSLQTSIGEAFEVADEGSISIKKGSQRDPTQIETPLNWPPERAGSSIEITDAEL